MAELKDRAGHWEGTDAALPSPVCGGDRVQSSRLKFAKSGLAEIFLKKRGGDILNAFREEGNGCPPGIWNQISGPHIGGRASLEVRPWFFLFDTESYTHQTANEV